MKKLFDPREGIVLYNRDPLRVTFYILWYDLWIGAYIDIDDMITYVNLFPCCVLKFQRVAQS